MRFWFALLWKIIDRPVCLFVLSEIEELSKPVADIANGLCVELILATSGFCLGQQV